MALGSGKTLEVIRQEFTEVAEGVSTAPALMSLAKKLNVEMPICEGDDVLIGKLTAADAAHMLLNRPLRKEGLGQA